MTAMPAGPFRPSAAAQGSASAAVQHPTVLFPAAISPPAEKQQGANAEGEPEQLRLAVPHSFDELRSVRHTLELYRRNYAVHVAALLCTTHLFLQVGGLVCVCAGSMASWPAACLGL